MHAREGYSPVQYTGSKSAFWGTLLSSQWEPSQIFCRLVDSLFFYMDERAEGVSRNTGRMGFDKILALQTITGNNDIEKLPYPVWVNIFVSIWQADGTDFTVLEDSDGNKHPILDRQNWLHSCVRDVQYDPDGEYQFWSAALTSLELVDPMTGLKFPQSIPRASFPGWGDPESKATRDQAVVRFLKSIVLQHSHTHTQFSRLVTVTGYVQCDSCGEQLIGTRYKCKTCFDYDECDRCFHTVPTVGQPVAAAPTSPANQHKFWHTFLRFYVGPGSFRCDACGSLNEHWRNRCSDPGCPDYDECDRCREAALNYSAGHSAPPPSTDAPPPYSRAQQTESSLVERSAEVSNIAKIISSALGLVNFASDAGLF